MMKLFGYELVRAKATRFLGDLAKVQIKQGDVCVLMANETVTPEEAKNFAAAWRAKFGETALIILDKGMRLGVLSPAQSAKATMHIEDAKAVDKALEST